MAGAVAMVEERLVEEETKVVAREVAMVAAEGVGWVAVRAVVVAACPVESMVVAREAGMVEAPAAETTVE